MAFDNTTDLYIIHTKSIKDILHYKNDSYITYLAIHMVIHSFKNIFVSSNIKTQKWKLGQVEYNI